MKNIVSRKTLVLFYAKHADAEIPLLTWYKIAMKSNWTSPIEVKKDYASADIVGNDRMVFNVKGNKYLLIVKFNFGMQWAWIRFIGTHAEYDKIEACSI